MKRTVFRAGQYALASLLAAMVTTSCQTGRDSDLLSPDAGVAAPSGARLSANVDYVAGEVLVKFRKGADKEKKDKALGKVKAEVAEKIKTKAMEKAGDDEGLTLIKTPLSVEEAIAELKGSPDVELAEPNYIYHHQAVSTDPYFTNGSLWGMYGPSTSPSNAFGSNAAAAWAGGNTGTRSVVVGIIDEGFQPNHPDLDANVWTNPFDPVDGRDNDGNGYIDDTNGWDFANNDRTIYDGGNRGSLDDHGTHVAGTIGAEANGSGVAGVNWAVTMISAKCLGRNGGTTANAIKAVDYLTDLKIRHGLNIVASNNSWGGGGYSKALFDAIERANSAGILFIAAAGNGGSDGVGDNNDVTLSYPSGYSNENVIAVASITSSGARSSFSNFGATTVDIGAPGSGIWSTTAFNTYSSYNGTSMATPHVTGAAALYAAAKPGATATTIKNAILTSAVPTASLSGRCTTGGRLDVNAMLSK